MHRGAFPPTVRAVPASQIHVVPLRGRWAVRDARDPRPASEHKTATEATLAARGLARASGAASIVVHDLYMRVSEQAVDLGARA